MRINKTIIGFKYKDGNVNFFGLIILYYINECFIDMYNYIFD